MRYSLALLCGCVVGAWGVSSCGQESDVVVYGGTPSGLAAAVALRRAMPSASVCVVENSQHVGGMMTGGLGKTDVGNASAISGIAAEVFDRIGQHYSNRSVAQYDFEPHVAEAVFEAMLVQEGVQVAFGERIVGVELAKEVERAKGVERGSLHKRRGWRGGVEGGGMEGGGKWVEKGRKMGGGEFGGHLRHGFDGDGRYSALSALVMESGRRFSGGVFLDASYEGDLMVLSGCDFTFGRESNTTYNESMGGRLPLPTPWGNWQQQFEVFVNGTGADGEPLPLLYRGDAGEPGQGDGKVMAYNFRMTLTPSSAPFADRPLPPPDASSRYADPATWELFRRYIAALPPASKTDLHHYFSPGQIPNEKTDVNNEGAISTDHIGASWEWRELNWTRRDSILQDHVQYTLGLFHFLSTDAAVPQPIRNATARLWLTKDEFQDGDVVGIRGFPRALYVRAANRLQGEYVFTQKDRAYDTRKGNQSIALGSYNIDVHQVQRFIGPKSGKVTNEGNEDHYGGPLFEIPFQILTPKIAPKIEAAGRGGKENGLEVEEGGGKEVEKEAEQEEEYYGEANGHREAKGYGDKDEEEQEEEEEEYYYGDVKFISERRGTIASGESGGEKRRRTVEGRGNGGEMQSLLRGGATTPPTPPPTPPPTRPPLSSSSLQPGNLLVPVAVSSSYVGFGCLRLEPQWMELGQAAGVAAAVALQTGSPAPELDVQRIRDILTHQGVRVNI